MPALLSSSSRLFGRLRDFRFARSRVYCRELRAAPQRPGHSDDHATRSLPHTVGWQAALISSAIGMADDEIPLVPPVPPALREAAQLGTIVPFVGAGASLLAGCPGWVECANGALRFFVDHGILSHAQLERMHRLSPRVKLTLALSLQEEHKLKIDFRSQDQLKSLISKLDQLGQRPAALKYCEQLRHIPGIADLFSSLTGSC